MAPRDEPTIGARRMARLWRRSERERLGVPHPPKNLGKKARRAQRQQQALDRLAAS